MFASGKLISLTAKLNAADTTLYADIDVGVTNGRLYFVSDLQEEWLSFTGVAASGSSYAYSGLTRGLSQTADPATAGTGKTWLAGNTGTLVEMHDQMADKQTANTWTGAQTMPDIRFSGTTTSGLRVKSVTTAQRNALTPANGDVVYDSDLGENYQYIGGAWSAVSSGSTQPNASTAVAGKVEIATTAESIAGTDTGGTGALLSVLPSDIAKNNQSDSFKYAADAGSNDTYVIALTPALTAYTTGQKIRFKANTANTGACTININGLGAKSIKDRAGNDPVNGLIAANDFTDLYYDGTNFVIDSAPKPATDAEAITGTDITKYVTPAQAILKTDTVILTRDNTTASGTVTYNHSLGRVPKNIQVHTLDATNFFAVGGYDGSGQNCVYVTGTPGAANSTAYSLRTKASGTDFQTGVIQNLTTTQFDIVWTKTGTPTNVVSILATLIG